MRITGIVLSENKYIYHVIYFKIRLNYFEIRKTLKLLKKSEDNFRSMNEILIKAWNFALSNAFSFI